MEGGREKPHAAYNAPVHVSSSFWHQLAWEHQNVRRFEVAVHHRRRHVVKMIETAQDVQEQLQHV
jgi:hypothetical protein